MRGVLCGGVRNRARHPSACAVRPEPFWLFRRRVHGGVLALHRNGLRLACKTEPFAAIRSRFSLYYLCRPFSEGWSR
jgi:hypothetical protein